VFSDPERVISKEHAKIIFASGAFFVVGLGRNGVYMNGRATPLDAEVPAMLRPGDRLRLGRAEILVEEIVAPARGPAPLAAAGPRAAPAPAVNAERRLSEEWEARLGELLRTPVTGPAPDATVAASAGAAGVDGTTTRPAAAVAPATLGPLVDLPPPTVVLAPEPQAGAEAPKLSDHPGEPLTQWNREGPLSSLLLGQEVQPPPRYASSADIPPARPEPRRLELPPPRMAPDPLPRQADPVADLPPLRMTDPPRGAHAAPPLPPDAAFLRGVGIGLPQLSAAEAAVMAYDLGRALAALADLMVEVSHRQDPPGGAPPATGPFAALPTGPLALSELVASADYRPGQIERTVREAIARTRRLHGDAADGAGIDVAALAPAALMRRWNLDPRRRDSAARAWALYETRFPELVTTARNGRDTAAELANRLAPTPRTRAP
jgi:predicted component of type VI protein secretion system